MSESHFVAEDLIAGVTVAETGGEAGVEVTVGLERGDIPAGGSLIRGRSGEGASREGGNGEEEGGGNLHTERMYWFKRKERVVKE